MLDALIKAELKKRKRDRFYLFREMKMVNIIITVFKSTRCCADTIFDRGGIFNHSMDQT
jgi:hypothetical protein